MSSQTVHSISDLSLLPDVEFEAAFKNSLPNLLQVIRNETGATHSPIITAFERFFKLIKVLDSSTDGEVIQNVVSILLDVFSKNLNEADNIERLKCQLKENTRILASLIVLINTLVSIPDVKVEMISSVSKDAISVLLLGFQYCKNNSQLTTLREQITQLFETCYVFLRDYFVFINKLRFSCQYESEFNLLIEILDKMYEIGALVISLDLKTMAELWKGYTQVLKTYASQLRNDFDVSKIISFLIHHITERITSLDNLSDDKILNLASKICAFLLKIIVKLCEYFEHCFGNCSVELLEFVLFLYKHSCFLCEFSGLNVALASKLDTYLVPGVDPLLSILINDRQFAKLYLKFNLRDKTAWDKIAFLSLSSLTMRKLLTCSEEAVDIWINDAEWNILHRTFQTIEDCNKELYYDARISLPCSDACLSQEVFIYDALLVSFSTFIINAISHEKFPVVENLLIENLLNSSPSVGIFTSDLWCILARYGSSDLCFGHVKFLLSVSNEIPEGSVRILVKSLLKRLFGFLSLNHQLQLISDLPLDETFIDCYNCLGSKFRGQICQKTVANVANKYKHVQVNLKQKFDGENYAKMIHLVNLLCTLESAYWTNYSSSVIDFVTQTWKRLRAPLLDQMNSKEFQSIFASLNNLTRITCLLIPSLGNTQVLDILRTIRFLTASESLRMKLCCLKILLSLQNYQIDSCFDDITSTLAECFNCGLISEHPVVNQFFLDGFTRFSHVTNYEIIISLTVSKNKLVAERVARYLQRNPSPVIEKQSLYQFTCFLIEKAANKNAIENVKNIKSDDQVLVAAKRIKLEDDFDDRIAQVEDLLETLFQRVQSKNIDHRQKEAALKMLRNLDKWREYLENEPNLSVI